MSPVSGSPTPHVTGGFIGHFQVSVYWSFSVFCGVTRLSTLCFSSSVSTLSLKKVSWRPHVVLIWPKWWRRWGRWSIFLRTAPLTETQQETRVPHVAAPVRFPEVGVNLTVDFVFSWDCVCPGSLSHGFCGTGRMQLSPLCLILFAGHEDQLVAVIPCNDVRLKPRRT